MRLRRVFQILPPLQQHAQAVAGAKRNQALRLYGKAGLQSQPVTLRNGRKNERCFCHRESGTDADARAAAERNIRKARTLGGALRRKTLGVEAIGILPERWL